MPHLQYASFKDMTLPYSLSASSESPGFPPSNVRTIGKPFRSWRSLVTGPGQQSLHLEWLLPVPMVGVFVNQVVAGTLEIRTAATLGSAEVSQAILNPMPQDPRVVRGKYLVLFPGGVTPVQAMNLYPSVPLDVFFEIGDVVPITAWHQFADHFEAPLAWRRVQSVTTADILGGGTQQQKEGRAYVQLTLGNTFFKYIAMPEFLGQLNAPPGEPVLLFEDAIVTNLSQTYLMARLTTGRGGDDIQQKITTFSASMVFEEMI